MHEIILPQVGSVSHGATARADGVFPGSPKKGQPTYLQSDLMIIITSGSH